MAAILVLGVTAGCKPPVGPPPPTTAAPPAPKPAAPPAPRVSGESAGAVRLGMSAEEVTRLPGLTASPSTIQLEGESYPTLIVRRGGQTVALAELQDGKVWRLRVLDPALRTPQGAGLGTSAAQLQKLYGPGKLMTDEGSFCAAFGKAPGLSFCFAPGTGPPIKTWNDVVKRGLSVTAILVVGTEGG